MDLFSYQARRQRGCTALHPHSLRFELFGLPDMVLLSHKLSLFQARGGSQLEKLKAPPRPASPLAALFSPRGAEVEEEEEEQETRGLLGLGTIRTKVGSEVPPLYITSY